jgi:hypothetical protein
MSLTGLTSKLSELLSINMKYKLGSCGRRAQKADTLSDKIHLKFSKTLSTQMKRQFNSISIKFIYLYSTTQIALALKPVQKKQKK